MSQRSDSKVIDFVSETGLYINIPLVILEYLYRSTPKLSKMSIRLYLEYFRIWQSNDYQCSHSASVLADTLDATATTIKKSNKSLLDAGLIHRKTRTISNGGGQRAHISSTTYPAVPDDLLCSIKNMQIRKPYQDPAHGEIESLEQLLIHIQEDPSPTSNPSTYYSHVLSKLQKLAKDEPAKMNPRPHTGTLERIAAEITWSICDPEGQLASNPGYQSDTHRLNAALAVVKRGDWERPNKMPKNYLIDKPKCQMSTDNYSKKLEDPVF